MTTTPLIAIRQADGQMYLQEENPFKNNTDVAQTHAWMNFNEAHPPIIALFECEEGQQFFEGVDVRLGYAYRDNTKDPEGEYPGFVIDEDDIPSWCPYHKAFQIIEQKEIGNEPEEWIHPDEAAIGSLNDDLKAVTEQRDELLEALIGLVKEARIYIPTRDSEAFDIIHNAESAINKALNKIK